MYDMSSFPPRVALRQRCNHVGPSRVQLVCWQFRRTRRVDVSELDEAATFL
jgi:hypothetical protein